MAGRHEIDRLQRVQIRLAPRRGPGSDAVMPGMEGHVIDLARRARRARRESTVLLLAVIACNVGYGVASLVHGASTCAWFGILVASVAAHVTAWQLRCYRRELEQRILAWVTSSSRDVESPGSSSSRSS